MRPEPDDWGPTIYALFQQGVRPWELGEFTIPALACLARKGEREKSPDEMRRVLNRARGTMKDFMERIVTTDGEAR